MSLLDADFGSGLLPFRLDPLFAHSFWVQIEGLVVAGFTEVHGLESSITVEDRVEGGVAGYVHKIIKETTYPNLVLSRGMTEVEALWTWYEKTSRGVIKRKNVTLLLLDHFQGQRLPVMWWDVQDALPVKWTGPVFNAGQEQVIVESVELVHRGIKKSLLSSATAAAHLALSIGSQVGRKP
jgi:phage tail-like protein